MNRCLLKKQVNGKYFVPKVMAYNVLIFCQYYLQGI
jgi:hypothetical protein